MIITKWSLQENKDNKNRETEHVHESDNVKKLIIS